MTQADWIFKDNLKELLKQEWETDNRAKWKDGSPVKTKRIFGVVNRYDLSKEFPILTLKRTPLKSCFREIRWIYQLNSSNVNYLGLKIWDDWADEDGSIGEAYGRQVGKSVFGYNTQIDYVLNEIKRNPTSRRLIIEMWNVNELNQMNLVPCCHHIQFNVKKGKINAIVKQRSNDFVTANNFNVVEYALLIHMVARHTGYEVGELIHVIGDMHLYNKHLEAAEEILNRGVKVDVPKLVIDEHVSDFYKFTEDSFKLENYNPHPSIKVEVAI